MERRKLSQELKSHSRVAGGAALRDGGTGRGWEEGVGYSIWGEGKNAGPDPRPGEEGTVTV